MTDAAFPVSPVRDRRVSTDRRSVEHLFETLLRPGNWGSSFAYSLGLQGRLRVSTTRIDTGNGQREPLRIAFASDFHAGGFTDQRRLVEACEALASMKPDILLLGGDYVSVRGADISRLAPHIADIPTRYGKFGVLGNHDLRANHGLIVAALERAGVRVMTNEHVCMTGDYSDVSICGLDDPTYGAPRADLALDGAEGTRVVLMHSPDGIRAIGDRQFQLALCGHTHGGQVRLPWGPPLVIPGHRLNRRYASGRYELGSRTLLVSHGVGCSGVPVRTFAPPEVHLCLIT